MGRANQIKLYHFWNMRRAAHGNIALVYRHHLLSSCNTYAGPHNNYATIK
jgi:hypothetical protein